MLGDGTASGAYLLRITALADLCLAFGRFQAGRLFSLPAGDYLYVGSAMGGKLAARLLRHAIRTPGKPPHAVRPLLEEHLSGLGFTIPRIAPKRLHWHVDYLLDDQQAELTGILTIRSDIRLEDRLADRIVHLPGIGVIHPGLGASDCRNHTHLLAMDRAGRWNDIRGIAGKISGVKFGRI